MPATLEIEEKAQLGSVFSDLKDNQIAELKRLLRPIRYAAGELIFQEQELSPGLYLIRDGLVKYGKVSGQRKKRRILKILGPGDIFGEEALFRKEACACPGYARAIRDTDVFFLDKEAFLNLMSRNPAVAQQMCQWLTQELMVFQCKLVELAYEPVEKNLLRLLLILASRFGRREPDGLLIDVELSRYDLAELVGVHLDTVIRLLSKLRDQGLLAFRQHKIVILDDDRLRNLAQPTTTCLEERLF